jgi:hypothetical protein
MKFLLESLESGWPDGLKQKLVDGHRPVPQLFKQMFDRLCCMIGEKKWNAFCLDGDNSLVLMHGDTYQPVIEQLYMRIFRRNKLLSDHKEMYQKCVEAMVEDDNLYFEFFYKPEPVSQRRD